MTQTTIDITKIKDRDTAIVLDNVGTIFEAGTFSGTASVVAGTASREVTVSVAANLVSFVNSGTDTDIGTVFTPKGAGVVAIGGTTVANSSVQVTQVSSSVNFVKMDGAISTASPVVTATGTDTNVGLHVRTKGTGVLYLGGASAATAGIQVAATASAVNQIVVTNSATGAAPSIALGGSGADANQNLTIAAAGTGVVAFSNMIARKTSNALTAVGTNRATALLLTSDFNNITSAGASTGVQLPVGIIGSSVYINHGGANAITVYAAGSETIDTVAGATGVPLTNAKRCMYYFVAANTWISAQMGVVSA